MMHGVNRSTDRPRVLSWDLRSALPEDRLLQATEGIGALYPVGEWKPDTRPVILVHGLGSGFNDLQPLVDLVRKTGRQIWVFAFDATGRYTDDNGVDLAGQLASLRERFPSAAHLDIVGHSIGAVVARRALNELAEGARPGQLDAFERIRLVAIDTPWHGYPGLGLRLPFRKGAMDLQANSDLFQGRSDGGTLAERAGLLRTPLPPQVEIQLVSNDSRAAGVSQDSMLDYGDTESNWFVTLEGLTETVRTYLRTGEISGDTYARNYLAALQQDADWPRAEATLRALDRNETLTAGSLKNALLPFMPRYAGDHVSVLSNPEFLKDLAVALR